MSTTRGNDGASLQQMSLQSVDLGSRISSNAQIKSRQEQHQRHNRKLGLTLLQKSYSCTHLATPPGIHSLANLEGKKQKNLSLQGLHTSPNLGENCHAHQRNNQKQTLETRGPKMHSEEQCIFQNWQPSLTNHLR
jgi:hypothetical protein